MRASVTGAPCTIAAVAAALLSFSISTATALETGYKDGQTVEVAAFDQLVLTNGAMSVRRGDAYSVRIVDGSETLRIRQDDGALVIGCIERCPRGARHEVEITTPGALTAIAITGGGWIGIEDGFPEVEELDVTITGGGSIEAYSVPGRHVNAAITGGGELQVHAIETLDASILGGGSISYEGDPRVSKSIFGGGAISRR